MLYLVFMLISVALATDHKTNPKWKKHASNHKLNFASRKAEITAYKNFHAVDSFIENHNTNNNHSYSLAHNAFSTWSNDELKLHRGYIKSKNSSIEYRAVATNRAYRSNGHTFYVYTYTPGYQLKPSVDWLARGFNTPVRNQGSCGSCWAFAATGSIEAAMWIKSKIKVVLSPQQLVDCSTNYGNLGCDGGVVGWAYDYVWDKGLNQDNLIPYTAFDGRCSVTNGPSKLSGYYMVARNDDNALMEALDKFGPLPVAIDASSKQFDYYKSGLYATAIGACSSKSIDHAVLLVGYGINANGKKYWTIKNEWGTSWGMGGYMNISRDIKNNCGISSEVYIPIVA